MHPDAYQIDNGARTYMVVDDYVDQYQLLVAGRVLSEEFELPLSNFRVEIDHPGVNARVLQNGFFCLSGTVSRIFPDLYGTPGSGYVVNLSVSAPSHRSTSVAISIPAGSSLPLTQLNIELAYLPVRIAGRVTKAVDGNPVASAVVEASALDLLLTRTPLHFDHSPGVVINEVSIVPSGVSRLLVRAVSTSENSLILNDITGLGPLSLLRIGTPEQYEYLVVNAPGGPQELITRGTVQRSYPTGTIIQPVSATATMVSSTLSGMVEAGTALLPLTGNMSASTVSIDVPPNQEFQAISALSNAEGYYVADGIAGEETMSLLVTHPAGPELTDGIWRISPERPVNIINFRLSPP